MTEETPEGQKVLIQACIIDAVCLAGGIGLFFVTGSWIWIVAGALLGAGFSLPAIIKYQRERG